MTERGSYLIPIVVLQACAAPASVRTPAAPAPVEAAAPVAGDAPTADAPVEAAAPVAGDAPTADAPDDAEIDRRIAEDSAPLREVHDAEVRGSGAEEAAPDDSPEHAPVLPELEHDLRRLQAEYDIPIDVNEAVVKYIRFFQSAEVRPHFVRWLSRSHRYAPRFREILREEGLPEDTVYLAMIESGFANLATSRAKAVGAWQFIEETGRRFGLRRDFWIDERRDPEKSARAAARFLGELHQRHGDWRLAWAAYNAGPRRISRARRLGYSSFWDMARARRVLPAETRAYVPKIMAAAIVAKHAESFGLASDHAEPERWIEYEEVVVPRTTELSFLAEAAQVPIEVLLDLNPELRRTCTPPRPYALKIPRDSAQAFAERWPGISERAARTAVVRHQVRRGETLAAVGRAYGVSPAVLATLNKLRSRRLRAETVLVIPLGTEPRRDAEAVARRSMPAHGKVRVRRGDSLWVLARRFGVTVHELARWNGIRDPELHTLRAGRVLAVPRHAAATRVARGAKPAHATRRAPPAASAASATTTVRVRRGDSLWSLARRFGITIEELARRNGIQKPQRHMLPAGRILVVPRRDGS